MTPLAPLAAELNERLQHQPGFRDVEFVVRPLERPPVAKAYPRSKQAAIRQVPAAFLPIYEQTNYLAVGWKYDDPAGQPPGIIGKCFIAPILNLFTGRPHDYSNGQGDWLANSHPEAAGYHLFDYAPDHTYTLWRPGSDREELAFYVADARPLPLPFTPVEYVETGFALRFIELWQLLFIPEAEQAAYADAIGTVAAQVRQLFPESAHLIPAHVTARFPAPPPLPPSPDYRRLRLEVLERLRAVPGLEWEERGSSQLSGATLGQFEQVRRKTGWAVPPELQAFYGRLNGFHLTWWWADQDYHEERRGGSLQFWGMDRVFGGFNSSTRKMWDDTLNDGELWARGHAAEVPGLGPLRPFELIRAEYYPCLKLTSDPTVPAELFWLTGDLDEIYPLRLGFAEYMARAFACAGVYKWQFFYRTDELQGEDPDFARKIEDDLRRLGLNPDQVLPDRQA